ncbi:MAG: hypothetical protein DME42_09895, partial [Verrucomicrobia bacterium]
MTARNRAITPRSVSIESDKVCSLSWRRNWAFITGCQRLSELSNGSLFLALEIEPAARLVRFGEIEIEGTRYTHDVVIDSG